MAKTVVFGSATSVVVIVCRPSRPQLNESTARAVWDHALTHQTILPVTLLGTSSLSTCENNRLCRAAADSQLQQNRNGIAAGKRFFEIARQAQSERQPASAAQLMRTVGGVNIDQR